MALRNKTVTALEANIATIKGTVQCPQVAEGLTDLRASGNDLRGQCPLPEHGGSSPSFYCYDNGQRFYDRWRCFRCNEGGDVLDLYGHLHGMQRETVACVDGIARDFNLDLWRRDDFEGKRERQFRLAKERAEKRIERYFLERLFEESVMPLIRDIPDESERAEKLDDALASCGLAPRNRSPRFAGKGGVGGGRGRVPTRKAVVGPKDQLPTDKDNATPLYGARSSR